MAIKLTDAYTTNANPASADYPQGSFKNASGPGAGDGTPLDQQWANDFLGFFQALLALAGITPSGVPDTATASQYLTALAAVLVGIKVNSAVAADSATNAANAAVSANALLLNGKKWVQIAQDTISLTAGESADIQLLRNKYGDANYPQNIYQFCITPSNPDAIQSYSILPSYISGIYDSLHITNGDSHTSGYRYTVWSWQ